MHEYYFEVLMKVHFSPQTATVVHAYVGLSLLQTLLLYFSSSAAISRTACTLTRAAQMKGTLIWIILRFPHLIKDIFHKCRLFLDQSSVAVIV